MEKQSNITNNPLEIKEGSLKFYIGDDETQPLAEITFIYREGNLVIEHTVVSDALKGRGVAKLLVERVVAFAKQEAIKINPICSYAKKVLTEDAKYRNILADDILLNNTDEIKED